MNDIDRTPDLDNSGSFAVRLWHARSSLNITQEELASRAGIPGGQTTIAHYEAGRREPNLENLRRLVWALGESADYLLATRPRTDEPYRAADCTAGKRVMRVRIVPPDNATESMREQAGDIEVVGRLYVLRTPEGTSEVEHEALATRLKGALGEAYADGTPFSWLVMSHDWRIDECDVEGA
jgi:transcriptional regulator with XRE-family HTH domain